MMKTKSRRKFLMGLSALAAMPMFQYSLHRDTQMIRRKIPGTNESLPVVGLGTWQTFDVEEKSPLKDQLTEVLQTLLAQGGTVVDSSPMYGNSERVVGALSTNAKLNDQLFIATKVWTTGKDNGIRQMNESFRFLKRDTIDLMQIHNLTDWKTHLPLLRTWKSQGRVRYIGITHYSRSAYRDVESIMLNEDIDFVQINYSIGSREAEERILPAASKRNIGVLINRPFEEGALFNRVRNASLPEWAAEFDCKSWGSFFLKFILSHPAVTCVIPGTSKPHHMLDNASAGKGKFPDEKQRREMIEYFTRL